MAGLLLVSPVCSVRGGGGLCSSESAADQADAASGHTPVASAVRQRLDGTQSTSECISSAKESPMGTAELRTTGRLSFIRSLDGRGLEQLLTA